MKKKDKNKSIDPFDSLILDEYEQEIEDSASDNNSALQVSSNDRALFKKLASKHKELQRSKRINIRINNEDLAKVKAKANQNKIPYQTLISSIVHKFAEGELTVTL